MNASTTIKYVVTCYLLLHYLVLDTLYIKIIFVAIKYVAYYTLPMHRGLAEAKVIILPHAALISSSCIES